ncbi:MAG: divalent-cation tolerance protein CutA [Candidatus Aegiribacteria sp.]|nr:divalent-cation tolerance protein CutA [Candidatus Aegiribacteria sp.]
MVQVTTAVKSREYAEEIARRVVEEKLAACVQVSGPVTSLYTWKGEICMEEEWLCVMKTLRSRSRELMEFVRRNHPYETPEIIVLPVIDAFQDYLDWITEVT